MGIDIILYSDGSERCKILKKKLTDHKFRFTECTDAAVIDKLGIDRLPVLSVDREFMGYSETMKFLDILSGGDCDA